MSLLIESDRPYFCLSGPLVRHIWQRLPYKANWLTVETGALSFTLDFLNWAANKNSNKIWDFSFWGEHTCSLKTIFNIYFRHHQKTMSCAGTHITWIVFNMDQCDNRSRSRRYRHVLWFCTSRLSVHSSYFKLVMIEKAKLNSNMMLLALSQKANPYMKMKMRLIPQLNTVLTFLAWSCGMQFYWHICVHKFGILFGELLALSWSKNSSVKHKGF